MAFDEMKRELDFTHLESPPTLCDHSLVSESKVIEVTLENKLLKVHMKQVTRKDGQHCLDVLFLHGMRFTSQNWLDVKSLYHVANWGHRGVAVDLPGFGKSMCILEPELKGTFLKCLIAALGLHSDCFLHQ